MTTPVWSPGTLYQPGDLVRPRSAVGGAATPPDNPDFEVGTFDDWTATAVGGSASGAVSTTYKFTGTKSFLWAGGSGSQQEGGIGCDLVNDLRAPVAPGQSITANCYCMSVPLHREHGVFGSVRLYWYNASDELIAVSATPAYGDGGPGHGFGTTGQWVLSTLTAAAPPGASTVSIGAFLLSNQGDTNGSYVDAFSWSYISPSASDALVFRAVQPASGFSGSEEPAWPVVLGETVYDNEVIWEAVATSRVVWEASPILVSGATEPDFPEVVDGSVVDNTIVWQAINRRIADEKCPHSKVVAIAASKIFAGDDDIIAYCSTVNPLDWSSPKDAGYLPFGLQSYGANPVAALGLYRSNLVASSSSGYQMWQVDPNPENMAYLDGQPVPFEYHLSLQPVANDLVGLTNLGIRSIGIAGASTNLQAGFFGQAVDPIVKPLIAAARAAGLDPIGLMWPAAGQYWLIFGATAVVLTVNGSSMKDMSWSRYEFPAEITDWTLDGLSLFLRVGEFVWEVSADAECIDDLLCDSGGMIAPILSGVIQDQDIFLTWTEATSESAPIDRYRLYRSTNGGIYTLIATTLAGEPREFLDTETALLLNGYAYHVVAYDANGTFIQSNTVTFAQGEAPLLAVFSVVGFPSGQPVMTSLNAANWTLKNATVSAAADYFHGAAWSPSLGLFVAIGLNQSIASEDGDTWTNNAVSGAFGAVCWSPELEIFVAVGGDLVATSVDGATFTNGTCPSGLWRSVIWVPDLALFVAGNFSGSMAAIMTSPDGITWTARGTANTAVSGLAYIDSLIVTSNPNDIGNMVSSDGINWTNITGNNPIGGFEAIAAGNGIFVCVRNNYTMKSEDGAIWDAALLPGDLAQQWSSVIFAEDFGLFIAASIAGTSEMRIMVSADGALWGGNSTPLAADAAQWRPLVAGRISLEP